MLEIRPAATPEDDQASLDAYNAVWPANAVTLNEVEDVKRDARSWIDLLAHVDGELAGSGFASVHARRPTVAFTLVTVLPAHRRRGAGTALYEAISSWGRDQAVEELDAPCPEDDAASIAFAQRRGFSIVERNGRLVLELGDVDAPEVAPPPGVTITSLAARPDTKLGIYTVAAQARVDVPGRGTDAMEPFEDWAAHLEGHGKPPDATFVALAEDEVIGFARLVLTDAQPHVAFHLMTGVRRDWRGRGVAGALKRAQVRWAKERGLRRLQTENELRNEPIRRLNERLGYHPAPGEVVLRGPLAP